MYAVIEDSGSQIKVSEGDIINVAIRELDADASSITFDRVLYAAEGDDVKIGVPMLSGATVEADILKQGRTKKVPVVKFKRRKNYLRMKNHRQDYLQVKVTKINA